MYQTEDGKTRIDVRMENETVWLSQAQMAELFQRDRSVITRHVNNAISEGEVDEKSNVQFLHVAHSDKPVAFYSLDIIISVGYRVKSLRGVQFRRWATGVLREYLAKGFALNDELLKQAGGGNYWRELLEHIRDIRSSEKVFYRQLLDLYATVPTMTHALQSRRNSSRSYRIKFTTPRTDTRRRKSLLNAQMPNGHSWA